MSASEKGKRRGGEWGHELEGFIIFPLENLVNNYFQMMQGPYTYALAGHKANPSLYSPQKEKGKPHNILFQAAAKCLW